MPLAPSNLTAESRKKAMVFSLADLKDLVWLAEHSDTFTFYTELEHFRRATATTTTISLPAVILPKHHHEGSFCKTYFYANRPNGNQIILFEPGEHGHFCRVAKLLTNAVHAYSHYDWTRRKRFYPNRRATLNRRFQRAAQALTRARRTLKRLLASSMAALTNPDAPEVLLRET
ncbi:unnamed protein product [Peniophora sp. CBMAI 1063]|nr:unnamed protein product [Peniophora sp. CBMAI 1063]